MVTTSPPPSRLDRLLTLAVFNPVANLLGVSSGFKIPILMYHHVAKDVDDQLHPYYRIVTTPEQCRSHVDFLGQEGYYVVTLSDAVCLLRGSSDRTDPAPLLSPSTALGAGTSSSPQRPTARVSWKFPAAEFTKGSDVMRPWRSSLCQRTSKSGH
jgi:hypothetical protein